MKKDFNEIAKKVTGFVAGAADKAVRYLDEKSVELELNANVKQKETELEELYTSYGKVMFSLGRNHGEEKDESTEDNLGCKMVRELYDKIEEKIEQLEAAKEILELFKKETGQIAVKCANCEAEFKNGERFCSKCGAKLE